MAAEPPAASPTAPPSTPPLDGRVLGTAAADWAADRRVAVGSYAMRYREAGRGPVLVLVHGLGMAADYWVRTGPPLAAAGLRVLAPDVPGFGRTPGPRDALDIAGQADALAAWADALALPPAVFLGHSLSCQVVLELAARHPARVRGLVLAAPTGDRSAGGIWTQALKLFYDALREPPALLPHAADAYLRAGMRRYWQTWHHGARQDPLPLLPAVHVPTLIVLGSDDPIVDPAYARQLADGLPDARLVTIEGAQHAVFFRKWREFSAVVEEWVEQRGETKE